MYLPRTLEPFVAQAAEQFPVLMVCGPRQVGKTTLLQKQAAGSHRYVTLDDPLALQLALDDGALFLQRFAPPVLIDEVQYAPNLLPLIKIAVDQSRRMGEFWLTGSQTFHLMQGVAESLAGRVAVVNLQGLSVAEAQGRGQSQTPFLPQPAGPESNTPVEDLMAVFGRIWRGSFPALITQPRLDRDLFYSSYVQTYLQRDVRDLAQIADLQAFTRFLRTAAARTGQLLNLAEMARDVGVAPNTCKNWLSVLEASGVVYLLEPWHSNLNKRLMKTPKLYFLDTGLAAYLTQWSSPETLEAGAMSGAIFETWVVAELLKSYWHNGKRAPFFYYRDKDQKEIDLLIEQDGTLYPVEIKKSASPTRDATRHFEVLHRLGRPIGHGALVCLVKQALPINSMVTMLPCVF